MLLVGALVLAMPAPTYGHGDTPETQAPGDDLYIRIIRAELELNFKLIDAVYAGDLQLALGKQF